MGELKLAKRSGNPTVKILVTCHKPSVVPDSDLFLPVHVGARLAPEPLPGAQPDDQGENISSRNFSFSEMSAQYWAWKNLPEKEADYVGQCHYRRFFCLDGLKHPANDHAQIELPVLNQESIGKYRLADEGLFRGALEEADALVPQAWSVVGVPTPNGPQSTIRSHMEAYELVDSESFDLFLDVVDQRQPAMASYVRNYLDGSEYIGYNCFVMRRDLFDEMSAFEFDVLLAFDKLFNYNNRTPTQMRICGYLAEILFSAYVNKLRAEDSVRVVEAPLTFFFETAPGVKPAVLSSLPSNSLIRRAASKAKRALVDCGSAASSAEPLEMGICPESEAARQTMVSIVVPAYNLEAYLAQCLESIEAQTHSNLQVIVVDDGSTDGTLSIARAFEGKDERFLVLDQAKSNAGEARNSGMAKATGDYLLFFDGDDLMEPFMVQLMVERALEADADVVVCRAASFYDDPKVHTAENFGPFGVDLSRVHEQADISDRLFSMGVGWPWDKLFRSQFVRANQLQFQSLSSTNDAAFVFQALALASKVAFVPEVLALHRRRQGSIEDSRNASPHNARAAFECIRDRLSNHPLWETVLRDSCTNWALSHLRWNYRTLSGVARNEAFEDYLAVLALTDEWDIGRFEHREDWWVRNALNLEDRPSQELLADLVIDCNYGKEDLGKLERRIAQLGSDASNQAEQLQKEELRLANCQEELRAVRESVSFRVGRLATAPLRKIRDIFR